MNHLCAAVAATVISTGCTLAQVNILTSTRTVHAHATATNPPLPPSDGGDLLQQTSAGGAFSQDLSSTAAQNTARAFQNSVVSPNRITDTGGIEETFRSATSGTNIYVQMESTLDVTFEVTAPVVVNFHTQLFPGLDTSSGTYSCDSTLAPAGSENLPLAYCYVNGATTVANFNGTLSPGAYRVRTTCSATSGPRRPSSQTPVTTSWRFETSLIVNAHCDADYNGDGDIGGDADIEAFFACLAGRCCNTCPPSADFNGDGDTGTDADIESFFRVLAGGAC